MNDKESPVVGSGHLEWRIIKEKRTSEWFKNSDGSPQDYDAIILKRDDGFSVERIGLQREMEEIFLCKSALGKFKFIASRWNESENKPSAQYVVYLFSPYIEVSSVEVLRSKAKDIESALINMPLHRIHDGISVKDVVFQISMYRNPANVLYALEL